jgi:hypothetical protein
MAKRSAARSGRNMALSAISPIMLQMCFIPSANIEDHSQIVRFVSSFISDSLMGKVRA